MLASTRLGCEYLEVANTLPYLPVGSVSRKKF